MVTIAAMADLHGHLPKALPPVDILLLAGDICCHGTAQMQANWLHDVFSPWLRRQPVGETVATWGNHDWVGQLGPVPDGIPWVVLTDQEHVTKHGLRVWGSPWQPIFCDWAFNLSEPDLAQRWELIPEDIDVLLLHGPPRGILDKNSRGQRCGSSSLRHWLDSRPRKPRLSVWGHIHEAVGVKYHSHETLANVSVVNEHYQVCRGPFMTTLG